MIQTILILGYEAEVLDRFPFKLCTLGYQLNTRNDYQSMIKEAAFPSWPLSRVLLGMLSIYLLFVTRL